ncbi:MAG: WecB/TagA/CpsF family glycosyltransferase [Myxococcales bacterium]|nr:WecB/TagA/CpsF family glycosyltransferase [Myxococcales bacterium]
MKLLPKATLIDVIRGKATLIGSRTDPNRPRGWVSPVEARALLGLEYGDLAEEEAAYLDADHSLSDQAATTARALLARLFSAGDPAVDLPRPTLVATPVDNITIEEALRRIVEPPPTHRARMVHFVHPHAVNLAATHPDFRTLLERADLILPDGIGLRFAAQILGVSLKHNINGTDLLPLLCEAARDNQLPLLLVGGAEGVAEDCAATLRNSFPGLDIPWTHHGFLNGDKSKDLAQRIAEHPGAIVLVGMGSPRQEQWSWDHLAPIPRITVVTVGGLFDFFSGRIPRAPLAWREAGFEWVWRLKQEPKRLAKRYIVGNPLFLSRALKQRMTQGKPKG